MLDGNSILNRAFYGIRMLSNKKGQMTNAVYGFLSTLQKLISEVQPDAVAAAFDLPQPTFRHKMYSQYKATRKKMPEELTSQVPILKELLSAMGYRLISCAGYEADDILGTFAKYCEQKNYDCVLATGDKDSLQLISKKVTVRIAATKFGRAEPVFYDENKVKEEYGVMPQALIDIKALQGDASDNIPGVKGIGGKTSRELIEKFGSIDYIYSNLENLDIKESIKNKLRQDRDTAQISYELGTVNRDVPINIHDQDYIPAKMDSSKVKKIMTELEFFSFIDKMEWNDDEEKKSEILSEILNDSEIKDLFDKIKNKNSVSFLADIENFEIKNLYVEFENKVYVMSSEQKNFYNFLKAFTEAENIEKITYDIKKLIRALEKVNIKLNGTKFDVMLASYLLSPSSKDYGISRIAGEHNIVSPHVTSMKEINLDEQIIENVKKVYFTEEIYKILKKELEKRDQLELLFDIEQPLAQVLASMENIGFAVDKEGLERYGADLTRQLADAQKSIYELAGFEFNINSPKQLGFVLFEKLGLPKGKKGKSGYSTSAETLEKLKGYHEIIDMILEHRALAKLKSTYCDGMIKLITPEGRIHSSFNQTETRTGRISSTEPNLQNIPVRTERGRELRKFFKAKEGCVLVDADYSQIELRVLAHISEDKNMINAFKHNDDIHTITASQVFGVPLQMVTSEMRARAKVVNFGIIYGMGAFSLSQTLKISRYEAQHYIDRYLKHYKGVDEYMHGIVELAKKHGYAQTMCRRRRYLPEIESPNFVLRSFGERVARNMPIQGSAADIIKIAMVNVYKSLEKKRLSSKLILQVHDELIIEALETEVEEVKTLLESEMENAVQMKVPLEVHISAGKTWFDAKD